MTALRGLPVRGRILPQPPFVVATEHGQALNFDLELTNTCDRVVELTQLEITFMAAAGHVCSRRVGLGGSIPGIETVPRRTIKAEETRLFFNPVEYAPCEPPIVAVGVAATLATGAASTVVSLESGVRPEGTESFVLPVAGRIWVWDGHDYLSPHRRCDYTDPRVREQGITSNPMRYAYDLVVVDQQGRHHLGDGSRNEDYLGFGSTVRAPAAGTIVEVVDHRPDDGVRDMTESLYDPNFLLGNRIVIDHRDGTYSHLAHIRQGSAVVETGWQVEAGDPLAAIGNSGSSRFPHLHYQRVDAPTLHGEGVPSRFTGVVLDRGTRQPPVNGHLRSGDILNAE